MQQGTEPGRNRDGTGRYHGTVPVHSAGRPIAPRHHTRDQIPAWSGTGMQELVFGRGHPIAEVPVPADHARGGVDEPEGEGTGLDWVVTPKAAIGAARSGHRPRWQAGRADRSGGESRGQCRWTRTPGDHPSAEKRSRTPLSQPAGKDRAAGSPSPGRLRRRAFGSTTWTRSVESCTRGPS